MKKFFAVQEPLKNYAEKLVFTSLHGYSDRQDAHFGQILGIGASENGFSETLRDERFARWLETLTSGTNIPSWIVAGEYRSEVEPVSRVLSGHVMRTQ